MIERTIAIRYARALLELAKSESKVDDFGGQIHAFNDLCVEHVDLMDALSTKGFGHVNRLNVLNEVLKKTDFASHVQNFLRLLVRKGRMELLNHICEQYDTLANKVMGRLPMIVESAHDLHDSQYSELEKIFEAKTNKKMILRKKVNPELLGGVKVQIGDLIYDYTLSRQLSEMKERMMA